MRTRLDAMLTEDIGGLMTKTRNLLSAARMRSKEDLCVLFIGF
ncbi:hypothetical protein GALL_532720 [mine drainage metagenome]|uniref:Uncharacterized protein n=1 Tax=mine drainage metagenome TaxID=410659 RepID=A0A1J5PCD2_9ZZZZ